MQKLKWIIINVCVVYNQLEREMSSYTVGGALTPVWWRQGSMTNDVKHDKYYKLQWWEITVTHVHVFTLKVQKNWTVSGWQTHTDAKYNLLQTISSRLNTGGSRGWQKESVPASRPVPGEACVELRESSWENSSLETPSPDLPFLNSWNNKCSDLRRFECTSV